jgi:hypothetical protein
VDLGNGSFKPHRPAAAQAIGRMSGGGHVITLARRRDRYSHGSVLGNDSRNAPVPTRGCVNPLGWRFNPQSVAYLTTSFDEMIECIAVLSLVSRVKDETYEERTDAEHQS